MATLATYFRKDDTVIYGEEAPASARRRVARPADPYRLRSLPNEDVYFFCKRIDNTRLLKQKDPGATRQCWSAIGAFALLAVLLAGALAPSVWGTFAGIVRLSQTGAQRLGDERSAGTTKPRCSASPSGKAPRAGLLQARTRAGDSSRSTRRWVAGHESSQVGPAFMPVQSSFTGRWTGSVLPAAKSQTLAAARHRRFAGPA
jgi:hypothetical protein